MLAGVGRSFKQPSLRAPPAGQRGSNHSVPGERAACWLPRSCATASPSPDPASGSETGRTRQDQPLGRTPGSSALWLAGYRETLSTRRAAHLCSPLPGVHASPSRGHRSRLSPHPPPRHHLTVHRPRRLFSFFLCHLTPPPDCPRLGKENVLPEPHQCLQQSRRSVNMCVLRSAVTIPAEGGGGSWCGCRRTKGQRPRKSVSGSEGFPASERSEVLAAAGHAPRGRLDGV